MPQDEERVQDKGLSEALRTIKEAERTGASILNLSNLGLTVVPDSITQLSQLEALNLSRNQITVFPDFLTQFSKLRTLSIASNWISVIPDSIAELSQLEALNFSDNHVRAIPDSISQLTRLRALHLTHNQITSIPDSVAQLDELRALALGGNLIAVIPESIARLSQLREVYLGRNQISAIPDIIAELGQLEFLILSNNSITTIPDSMAKLSQLRVVNFGGNAIPTIPDAIIHLHQLRSLFFDHNQITVIPEHISQLFQLQQLSLSNNQITTIPNSIAQLSWLKELSLSNNQITVVPEAIANLSRLEWLNLSNNRIRAVPEELSSLAKLRTIFLHGNPGLGVPQEIFGPTPHEVYSEQRRAKPPYEILAYLSKVSDSRPLNEAKLILVGQGNVGKSSLVKTLTTGKFKRNEKTTEGIKISDWECPLGKKDTAAVHIWDFGGQEMMHATHQFFLTQRSLYLLVLNRRTGGVDREADYWFRLIRAFGGKDAPVIVVLNKQKLEPFDVNREGWLEKYRGNIKGFVSTDCEDKKSITQLKRKIVEELQVMGSLKAKFPRRWFAIKGALSKMEAEHISFDDYRKLCQELGESDAASQISLAGFLHDLGIALNYGQDQRLRFNYVLKPEWVTQGIYALLHAFVPSKGIFTHAEAERELAKKKYSTDDTQFVLGLMERFELSFPLGDRQDRVLIPELLDDQQPKDAASFNPTECLNFGYKYPVVTEGLLPRFIARTHHLGRAETRWKSGVILEDSSTGCRALVRADATEADVRVHINGPQEFRRELLGIIRYNFEVIHSDYEVKPEAQVYPPAAPQKALSVDELEALARSKETSLRVVLPDKSVIDQNIAALIDPVTSTPPQLKLFLSYSHLDEGSIDELRKDLRVMERNGQIRPWYDRALTAGDKWEPAILQELNAADIVVCQISRNYLASDACIAELNAAVERNRSGEAAVVAYVLNDCGWKEEKGLKEFQLLPTDCKPLSDWNDANKYWHAVAEGIRKAVKKFQGEKKSRPSRAGMEN